MTAAQRKKQTDEFAKAFGCTLRRAAKEARKTARMYGTPIYVWEKGKVVIKETLVWVGFKAPHD